MWYFRGFTLQDVPFFYIFMQWDSWKISSLIESPLIHIAETSAPPAAEASPCGVPGRVWAVVLAFLALMHSVVFQFTQKLLPGSVSTSNANDDITSPGTAGPPPPPPPSFSNIDLISSVWKKLAELEDRVDMLQAKPHEMPYQKEELLNAAICRVDALEVELISTKKVITEKSPCMQKDPVSSASGNYRFSSRFLQLFIRAGPVRSSDEARRAPCLHWQSVRGQIAGDEMLQLLEPSLLVHLDTLWENEGSQLRYCLIAENLLLVKRCWSPHSRDDRLARFDNNTTVIGVAGSSYSIPIESK